MREPCIVQYRVGPRIYTKKMPRLDTLQDYALNDWERAKKWISGIPGAVLLIAGSWVNGVRQRSLFDSDAKDFNKVQVVQNEVA
jgi:hypothetical protein